MNERIIHWETPKDISKKIISLNKEDRIKFFSCLKNTDIPMGSLLGYKSLIVNKKGEAKVVCVPMEYHYNPMGIVHGGLAAAMLDTSNGITAQCQLNSGYVTLTVDLKINYLKPISKETGEITAKGKIVKVGRKVIIVNGELRDKNKNLLAVANSVELVVAK